MKKMKANFIALALIISIPVFSGVYEPDKLQVHLRMDKKTFYSEEAVILQVCVKNISERKNYFQVYDASAGESALYITFQPLVFDMSGREAETRVPYKVENRDISGLIKVLEKRRVERAQGGILHH